MRSTTFQRHAGRGKLGFAGDELLQAWMVQQIQVIGEAASRLSAAHVQGHAEVPWRQITDMRNLIVRAYFHVDPEIVWEVVERDIPLLGASVREMLTDG